MTALRAMKLFGTTEPVPQRRLMRAGPLDAILENGALRTIRYHGVEVIRMIAFLARDSSWGTYSARLSDLHVTQKDDRFLIRYRARCEDSEQALTYEVEITASADGILTFEANSLPETDFLTNRTGFVVLHPLEGVVGQALTVEHVDRSVERTVFPQNISPAQPVLDVRALSHQVIPGIIATVAMGPDRFEMEDHRNWMDASYKTYVRSLRDPWPYRLNKNEGFRQSVRLGFSGSTRRVMPSASIDPDPLVVGGISGFLPEVAAAVPMTRAVDAGLADLVRKAGLNRLIGMMDGRQTGIVKAARAYRKLKEATGAKLTLEVILPGITSARIEMAALADMMRDVGLQPDAVVVSCADHLRSYQPDAARPWSPGFAEMAEAARSQFPGIPIGGGTLAFFTELNRLPPADGLFDFITHTVCPCVHAADDASVMETLQAIPSMAASVRAMAGRTPYHLGPSGIAARNNPYGAGLTPNPARRRVCLTGDDPRQDGVFGAAFAVGLFAAFAAAGAASVALGDVAGPRGLVTSDGRRLHPVFHIMRCLAQAAGRPSRVLERVPEGIAAVGFVDADGPCLLVANLSARKRSIRLEGLGKPASQTSLDAASFDTAAGSDSFFVKCSKRHGPETLTLDAYSCHFVSCFAGPA
jgi:D-apionolactonase